MSVGVAAHSLMDGRVIDSAPGVGLLLHVVAVGGHPLPQAEVMLIPPTWIIRESKLLIGEGENHVRTQAAPTE